MEGIIYIAINMSRRVSWQAIKAGVVCESRWSPLNVNAWVRINEQVNCGSICYDNIIGHELLLVDRKHKVTNHETMSTIEMTIRFSKDRTVHVEMIDRIPLTTKVMTTESH